MAARRDAGQACHRAGRIRRPQPVDQQGLLPVRQAPQVGAGVFFCEPPPPPASTRSPGSGSSTLRRDASASSSSAADGRRRESAGLLPCAAFLFLGCNAAMPPLRYALTQPCTAPTPAPSLFGGLLLHATRHQLDCPSPCLQWDDGFGHMAGIPGIHRQPTLQALPGRITQMLHHLGRRHRRGEIQPHRTLSFLKTGHTKIFPFGLQENVRSPLSVRYCKSYSK